MARKIPLSIVFVWTFLALLIGSVFFPSFPLNFFVPALAITYYVRPFTGALWISLGSGILLDLVSSEFRFGIHALSFVLTTVVFYTQKKHFFEDKAVAFSLFCSALSTGMTLLEIVLIHLFDRGVPLSIIGAFTMSILDGIYAFLWFTCPLKLYTTIKKVGLRNFLRKKTIDEE